MGELREKSCRTQCRDKCGAGTQARGKQRNAFIKRLATGTSADYSYFVD